MAAFADFAPASCDRGQLPSNGRSTGIGINILSFFGNNGIFFVFCLCCCYFSQDVQPNRLEHAASLRMNTRCGRTP